MSYPGVPGPGNSGYWNGYGHDPPNFNSMPKAPTQPVQNGSNYPQYHTPQSNRLRVDQHQNSQVQFNQRPFSDQPSINPMQASLPVQPPTIHPQFINPAQLFQQAIPQYQSYSPASFHRQVPAPASNTLIKMSPANHPSPQLDRPALLMSLAEEYFDAAHSLAPSVSVAMTDTNVETYEKLISTGLACLDTAMKNVRLPPRVEANIRLRYAGILYEETENFMEAEIALSKGIVLCERVKRFIMSSLSF
jgi:Cohesin loading factor